MPRPCDRRKVRKGPHRTRHCIRPSYHQTISKSTHTRPCPATEGSPYGKVATAQSTASNHHTISTSDHQTINPRTAHPPQGLHRTHPDFSTNHIIKPSHHQTISTSAHQIISTSNHQILTHLTARKASSPSKCKRYTPDGKSSTATEKESEPPGTVPCFTRRPRSV